MPGTWWTRSARSRTRSRPTWCSATRTGRCCSRPTGAPSTAASARARAWWAAATARVSLERSRRRSRGCGRTPRCATSSSAAAIRSRWRPTASCASCARCARCRASRRSAWRRACPSRCPCASRASCSRALRPLHPLWVMTHFNHPRELIAAGHRGVQPPGRRGLSVMNQTVLLARRQRRRGDARGALPRPRPAARAALLPAAGRPGARARGTCGRRSIAACR